MNLTSKKKIVEILAKYNTKPIKGLGQNFIINQEAVNRIVSFAECKKNIVEIGPGLGTLTLELSKKLKQLSPKKKIVAVEKDIKMIEILKETLVDCKNVSVIHQDASVFVKNIILLDYEIVSCLPYYIASLLIRLFLETDRQPDRMILTVQKEVARRICSSPPDMSILSVSVQFYAQTRVLFDISKNSFWPQPRVDSSVIQIIPHKNITFDNNFNRLFFETVRAGFSKPRGQLLNNLSKKLKLEKNRIKDVLLLSDINPERRAETLNVKEWVDFTSKLM